MDWQFLLPEVISRAISSQRRSFFENELVPKAVAWDEDATKFHEYLCIKGESYSPVKLFDVQTTPHNSEKLNPENSAISPCGKYVFAVRELARGKSLDLVQGRRRGSVFFTTPVEIPILAEIVSPRLSPKTWMSMTPQEAISQRSGIRLATGKVMVGGLGMGWFLAKVAAKPSVTSIVLVERSKALCDWILPEVKKKWPHVNDKLTDVVFDDAVASIGRFGEGTRYLLDIWERYGDARTDKEFQQAVVRHEHVWGWGDVHRGKS